MANLASIIPTSPTAFVFGSSAPEASMVSKGEGQGEGGEKDDGKSGDSEGYKSDITPKEFFWDKFLIYIATIVALLTALDVTLQFFRGGGLVCRVPAENDGNETTEPTRDDVAYVNTFCQQSLSLAEYYPLFVLIQGLVLAAPQYLWAALFGGQFDFFFGLVRQLDRLRSSETGEYRSQNFEIVNKLEKHFPQKWKWISIFSFYVGKLILQLLVVVFSIIINTTVFQEHYFAFSFQCPENFNPSSPPDGWWLPFSVSCVFSSFRLHSRLQIANYLLLALALCAILYGLFWCTKRHVNALGYRETALFAFTSCLRPEEYVHENLWKRPLGPGIRNDLDFLVMRLHRADSGHGNVFKDIQVEREVKREVGKDHELLHLYLDAVKDQFTKPRLQQEADRIRRSGEDSSHLAESSKYASDRGGDLRRYFMDAGFSSKPEVETFGVLGKGTLGNIEFESLSSIRDVFFGFLQFANHNRLALDISFGTTGYSLILARAFQEVISLNFHPFYSNEKEICREEDFHTNYCTIKFQENILTKRTDCLNKVDETIGSHFDGNRPGKPPVRANFIVVGPFTDSAKIATVNLFLERQHTAERFDEGSILMYIRPLKIGPRNVSQHFCKFVPPQNMFELAMDDVDQKLRDANRPYVTVDGDSGIKVKCHNTECIFEFTIYEFIGTFRDLSNTSRDGSPIPPGGFRDGGSSKAGNIALIIPSQMLPELDRDKIQEFLDGNAAIQLQARSPGSPIEFILPPGRAKPDNDAAAQRLRPRDNREWEEENRALGQSQASSYHSVRETTTTTL